MRRVAAVVTSAADTISPLGETWVSVAVTYRGLRALGVPQPALDTMAWEFRQGMAARATALGDTGDNASEHWETPLGSPDVHVVLVALAPDTPTLEAAIDRARPAYEQLAGVTAIWRQNCHALPTETEPFGYRDGISHPAVDGSGIAGSNPLEQPLAAGEFVLGYPDELGGVQTTTPDVLGRNGSYVAFRKLRQDVAAFRRFLRDNSADVDEQERLAAKLMGRWRSGAPLALCPQHDDPELGADRERNNAFLFRDDDPDGFATPAAATCAGPTRVTRPWPASPGCTA
ncbi:Dyp-type peroxidase [Catellatospora coxensis]